MQATDHNSELGLLFNSAQNLQQRLNELGVGCKGVSILDGEGNSLLEFSSASAFLPNALHELFDRVKIEKQLCIGRDGEQGYLIAYPLFSSAKTIEHILIFWLELISEETITLIRLAAGWLHLPSLQKAAERAHEAVFLLDLQAYVFSQEKARAGVQEWVNRIAQLLRADEVPTECAVFFFRVDNNTTKKPVWWATSDTASIEKGAAMLHSATDAAARSALECRELQLADTWSFPVISLGDVIGVVVVSCNQSIEHKKNVVRYGASVMGVSIIHWHMSELGAIAKLIRSFKEIKRKLREPGFLTWKVGAFSFMFILSFLLVVPFNEHAAAKVVIEGQQQQIISAPFDGYWAEVLIRPGDQVKEGQLMARFDTQDLEVEQQKLKSEKEQASGKLREAFAASDSVSVQQASAQLRQASAQLALVESKLQRAELRAPAAGGVIFGDWYDQIGSPVETGKKLFEIAAGEGYRVVLQVPEEEIARIELDQLGELRVTGMPQKLFKFRVNRVTAVAMLDDSKNTFRVEAILTEENAPLRPGMQGVGKVVVAKSNLLSIWMRPVARWLRMKIWSMWW